MEDKAGRIDDKAGVDALGATASKEGRQPFLTNRFLSESAPFPNQRLPFTDVCFRM
jgi:hypothetical protein